MSPTSYQTALPCDTDIKFLYRHCWCRRPESNRYGGLTPQDFKSCASAGSATPAHSLYLSILTQKERNVKCFFEEIQKNYEPHDGNAKFSLAAMHGARHMTALIAAAASFACAALRFYVSLNIVHSLVT